MPAGTGASKKVTMPPSSGRLPAEAPSISQNGMFSSEKRSSSDSRAARSGTANSTVQRSAMS